MDTQKITLPLRNAMEACSAVLPHVSTDRVTPAINCAAISGGSMLATDRYTVAEFKLAEAIDGPDLLLPLEAVKWVARIVVKNLLSFNLDSYTVTIAEPDEDMLVVSIESPERGQEAMRAFHRVKANFPKVVRLLREFKGGDAEPVVHIKPELLERFTGYARRWHHGEAMRFEMSASSSGKPGPILVSIGDFQGLIQPSLILSACGHTSKGK